jgi:hypothetical protein
MTIRVLNYAYLAPEIIAGIENELSKQHSLKDLMSWALSDSAKRFIPGVVKAVVVQDEFTHDVVVP